LPWKSGRLRGEELLTKGGLKGGGERSNRRKNWKVARSANQIWGRTKEVERTFVGEIRVKKKGNRLIKFPTVMRTIMHN